MHCVYNFTTGRAWEGAKYELQLQLAAGAVLTPSRKRKLQVALATRKHHCSSGRVIIK
jgi:hypothetical protein